jgi:hypothetical protein
VADCLADIPLSERAELPAEDLYALDAAAMGIFEKPENEAARRFVVRTDFRSRNYGNVSGAAHQTMLDPPRGIILHHTAGNMRADLPTLMGQTDRQVSSNDLVDKAGVVYELVPYNRRAWHAGSTDRGYYFDGNAAYWGIEISNYGNGVDPYPQAQVDAVVWRCRQLRKRWPNISRPDQVFRHRDYTSAKRDTSDNFPLAEVKRRIFAASDPTDNGLSGGTGEVPFDAGRFAFLSDHPDHEKIAKAAADAIDEFAGQGLASWGGNSPGEILWATRKAAESPFGEFVAVLVGYQATEHVSPAVSVVGSPDETDIVSTYRMDPKRPTAEVLERVIRVLCERRGLPADKVIASYRKRLGIATLPARPQPGTTSPQATVVDRYFASISTPWGPYEPIGQVIVEEADRAGLALEMACAIVEQESYGRNVLGCDQGRVGDRPPYCNQPVTRERVEHIIGPKKDFPHGMNGIGPCQLTWWEFVLRAEALGGVHVPRWNTRVAFGDLAGMLGRYSVAEAVGRYNAGGNWRSVQGTYVASVLKRRDAWYARLKGVAAGPTNPPAPGKPAKPAARTLLMVENGYLGLAFGDPSAYQGTHKGWDLWPETQGSRARIWAGLAGEVIEVRDHGSVSGFTQCLQVRFDNGFCAMIGHVKAGISSRWKAGDRFERYAELCEVGSASDGKGIRHAHIELFTDRTAALRYDHSKALDPAVYRSRIGDDGPILRVQGFSGRVGTAQAGPLTGADEVALAGGLGLVDMPCGKGEPA